jgi:serine/threonine protein kinase/tetratricopeptide (TPR) repeat protein
MINIPNYEIGALAGKGGVAEVYLAKHKLLDRNVAIKLISPAHSDDISDKRFLTEARVIAGLRHTHIVTIYDVGIYENKYYIIMEYLDGGDLKQMVKRGITVEQSLVVLCQIAEALQHAHDKGFIHRDIKSQNIMFRADGTAVLTDFGIVKDISAETGYTLDGTSVGTPNYMSPEQALGSKTIDWRTDIYSLGVTFYEMLTGSVPYVADSAISVALKHIKDPVPVLPEALSHFQPIIGKTMAKKPEDRFQSARELLKAIETLKKGEDLESSRHKDRKTGAMETRRESLAAAQKSNNRRLIFNVVVVGMAIGLLALLIVPYLDELLNHRQPSETAAKERSFSLETFDGSVASPRDDIHPVLQPDGSAEPFVDAKDELMGAIAEKDYLRALLVVRRLREELPAPSNPMLQKADELLISNQLISAGDMYATVLSVDPRSAPALLGLLHVAVEKQKELTSREKPSLAENDALMALLNKAVSHTDSPCIKQLIINAVEWVYESAETLFKQNDLDQAQQWAAAGLEFEPNHLRMKTLQHLILAQQRFNDDRLTMPDGDNALFYYEEILKIAPNDPAAKAGITRIVDRYGVMARAAWGKGRLDEALRLAAKAREIMPANASLKVMEWLINGDLYVSKSQYASPEKQNALYCYQQALSLSPNDKSVMLRIAKVEAYILLHQIRRTEVLSQKIAAYPPVLAALKNAVADYGQEAMADLGSAVLTEVKSDIQRHVDRDLSIPADFIERVSTVFPKEKAFFVSVEKLLRERAQISRLLNDIKQTRVFNDKIFLYQKLFDAMDKTKSRYAKQTGDLDNAVMIQIRDDVQSHHIKQTQLIPEEFIRIVSERFPEISEFLEAAQYDILIAAGDGATLDQEMRRYYLAALALRPQQADAIDRIGNLAGKMDENGKNEEAIDMLRQAMGIAPGNPTFGRLRIDIARVLDIFATAEMGCGTENAVIVEAPMTIGKLNLCIQYKNMNPDSIITIVLTHENTRTTTIPVVLEGRSGRQAVIVSAPMEGFASGEYVIAAMQDASVLSETRMRFIPPRRR